MWFKEEIFKLNSVWSSLRLKHDPVLKNYCSNLGGVLM